MSTLRYLEHNTRARCPAPAAISPITSVIMTEVLVYPKLAKKLFDPVLFGQFAHACIRPNFHTELAKRSFTWRMS